MNGNLLAAEYKKLSSDVQKVFVVPRITLSTSKTNYLFLLYEDFFTSNDFNIAIESLSVFTHPKLFTSRIKNERSILHYHWFEVNDVQSFFGMIWKLLWIFLYRICGGKIVWTVHNKYPHNRRYFRLNKILRMLFARFVHRLHVHCQTAVAIMSPILRVPKEKFFVIQHPEFPSTVMPSQNAREILFLKYPETQVLNSNIMLLMLGAISSYKGILEVIEIVKQHLPTATLIVAGAVKRWDKIYYNNVMQTASNSNTIVIPRNIPEDDVPLFMNSADCVVFNFSDILTSGSVLLALHYKKKIVIPSLGCLQELSGNNIFFFTPNNKESLKNILLSICKVGV